MEFWKVYSVSKKKSSSISTSRSYIEEDTKLEQKYRRPAWDKDFPNILPPPVRVPEKDNAEVDVEPDMMPTGTPMSDNKNLPVGDRKISNDVDGRLSEIIDPEILENPTQFSHETHSSTRQVKQVSRAPMRGLQEKVEQPKKKYLIRTNTTESSDLVKVNPQKKDVHTRSNLDKKKDEVEEIRNRDAS
ncbi:hypothetical protein KIN20_018147 [Parelaphostrongylus tenuis]|uniref:Uncharacterized protein n=1 Tax=Parelaphostrongylus tenuis TaxID=148309 RepID=A0AAD5N1N5_PARTN|nr:hypothetical protein KIN20_018147 [Parelaphostrongylus tenuis]